MCSVVSTPADIIAVIAGFPRQSALTGNAFVSRTVMARNVAVTDAAAFAGYAPVDTHAMAFSVFG